MLSLSILKFSSLKNCNLVFSNFINLISSNVICNNWYQSFLWIEDGVSWGKREGKPLVEEWVGLNGTVLSSMVHGNNRIPAHQVLYVALINFTVIIPRIQTSNICLNRFGCSFQ